MSTLMRSTCLLMLIFAASLAQAAIYKCTLDDQLIFQDKPCAVGEQELFRQDRAEPVVSGERIPVKAKARDRSQFLQEIQTRNRKRALQREIAKSSRQIKKYNTRKESELTGLSAKKKRALIKDKSYALVKRLNGDIAETTERYQSLLQAEETKLQNYREELKSLGRAPEAQTDNAGSTSAQ